MDLTTLDLDPIASPIGLVVIALGIRMVVGAIRTAVKVVFLGVVLVGAYLFLYGDRLTG